MNPETIELIEGHIVKAKEARVNYASMKTSGERYHIPRLDKAKVDVILYRPQSTKRDCLPLLFNMHGGAWLAGDAVHMDSYCQLLANEVDMFVVNVNYTKIDEETFPYALDEVVDSIKYFIEYADKFGIDPQQIAVGGHSAGGHIATGAVMKLKEEGISVACQMLVYPCTDLTAHDQFPMLKLITDYFLPQGGHDHRYLSPLQASDEELEGMPSTIMIICGIDELREMDIAYAKRLIDVAVPVKVKEYPRAVHGFLEINQVEYPPAEIKNAEQEAYCRDCEKYLIRELKATFN